LTGNLNEHQIVFVKLCGPGTAPGSQGVFGAKGVGSKMGARQLFGAGDCLVQLPGQVLNFLVCRKINQKRSELKYGGLFSSQHSGQVSIWFCKCELVRTITKMVPSSFEIKRNELWNQCT
jgi:hypothetical protein